MALGFLFVGVALAMLGPVAWAQRLGMFPILVLVTIGLLLAGRPRISEIVRQPAFLVLAAAAIWLLASLAWAPRIQPDRAGAAIGTLLLCGLAIALAHPAAGKRTNRRAVIVIASTGCLIMALIVDAATQGAGSALIRGVETVGPVMWSRGSAVLVVIVWIAIGLLIARKRYVLAAAMTAAALAAIWGGTMQAAKLASLAGLVAFLAAAALPRLVPVVLAVSGCLYGLAAPWLSLHILTAEAGIRLFPGLKLSAYHRLAIWEHAAARIVEQPLAGLGFGAARWISDQQERILIVPGIPVPVEAMPLHTHNGWLQLWLETGLIGLLFALALVTLAAAGALRRFRTRAPLMAASGAMAAAMAVVSFSFGIWQE